LLKVKFITILGILLVLIVPYSVPAGTSIFGFGPQRIGSSRYPYSVAALGRGGSEMGFVDSLNINMMNFASWTKLERTSISLNFSYNQIETKSDEARTQSSDGSFNGGFVTFPLLKKRFVMGLGLLPRISSDVGIQIVEAGPDQNTTQKIESDGNLAEALIAGTFALSSKTSMAGEVGYDFGVIRDIISVLYNDIAYGDLVIYDEYQMQGINYGISAFHEFNDRLSTGIRYKSTTQLTVHQERISSSMVSSVKQIRSFELPALVAIGLNYKFSPFWQIGMDGIYQNWSGSYAVDDQNVNDVQDSYRLGVGFEKSPEDKRFLPFFKSISWRGGLHLSRLNVDVNNNPVYEFGVTTGFGLPIIKHRNRIDVALIFGQRGSPKSTVLYENFFGITLSLLSSELWFVRQKR
jgi:hypothetical protein